MVRRRRERGVGRERERERERGREKERERGERKTFYLSPTFSLSMAILSRASFLLPPLLATKKFLSRDRQGERKEARDRIAIERENAGRDR